jgi:hypothetical protein
LSQYMDLLPILPNGNANPIAQIRLGKLRRPGGAGAKSPTNFDSVPSSEKS